METLFQSKDHREFLRTLMAEHKAKNSAFGLRRFATKAGFESPSTLSMILTGRRNLTPATAKKICQALSLTGRRRKYLMALIELDRAKTTAEKLQASERLLLLRNSSDGTQLQLTQYRFLATWYYPVIYVMATLKNFKNDPAAIARRLGRGITPEAVSQAIKEMFELGLLEQEGEHLRAAEPYLHTADEIRDLSARRYHSSMIQMALESIELPLDEREMNGLTVAVPKNQLPKMKAMIRKFRHDLHQFLAPFDEAEQVYQLNVQLFPLLRAETQDETKAGETS